MNLDGAVALITGGSGGIGAALGEELAKKGARVVLFARRAERLGEVVARIGSERALAVVGSVTEADDLRRAVRLAVERFGGLDILVNNAGIGLYGLIESLPADLLLETWKTNVLGVILAIQAALPALRKSDRALIVNISSVTSVLSSPSLAGYAMTKAALNLLTETLRKELREDGIRVLNIFPGYIGNEFADHAYIVDDSPVAQRLRVTRPARTSEDAARDIVAAIENDLEDWRYEVEAAKQTTSGAGNAASD
ncbi:MAG: SDR family oxidoreductase [Chloroflexota bacterium]|nr:SDR family oxidoreductase [Dehalococcoidia bacterium]MDW8253409.1 SDR family oxidoreductase [Chloroflexota bacterium]